MLLKIGFLLSITLFFCSGILLHARPNTNTHTHTLSYEYFLFFFLQSFVQSDSNSCANSHHSRSHPSLNLNIHSWSFLPLNSPFHNLMEKLWDKVQSKLKVLTHTHTQTFSVKVVCCPSPECLLALCLFFDCVPFHYCETHSY